MKSELKVGTNSTLAFWKKLNWATTTQIARAQVSTNGGASWVNLWSQGGANGLGDSGFARVTNSLAAFAGQSIRIRFIYDFTGGGIYFGTDADMGLRIDDIAVSNAQLLSGGSVSSGAAPSFALTPTNSATLQLRARARINTRTLPYGPATVISTILPPPGIRMLKPVVVGNQVQLEFDRGRSAWQADLENMEM